MRLAFMGTPDFAVPTLQALIAAGHDIVAVYSQPPARAGRGKIERKSPVHQCAEAAGLPVYTPTSFRVADAVETFQALEMDAAIVVAYGQLLPPAILDAPQHGCLNIHASLLPRWRGAAPVHRAIMAGDRETGVNIMLMDAGLDTGPVLAEARTDISDEDTTRSLHDRLADMGAALVCPVLEKYCDGLIKPQAQAESGVTYARKIDKAEAQINWYKPASDIGQLVRGLFPFPGAWCTIAGERVKILSGGVVSPTPATTDTVPGTVLAGDGLVIATGEGAYRVDRLQRAGKGPMATSDALRGFSVPPGTVLEGPSCNGTN